MTRTSVLARLGLALMAGVTLAAVDWKPVVDPYLQVQVALAADKIEGVNANASAMAAAAGRLGPAGAPVAEAAKKVAAAADLKTARTAFMDLSETLITAAGEALASDIRIAYCPMVKKRWLQTGSEIRNPYYGSQMLTCGTFKK